MREPNHGSMNSDPIATTPRLEALLGRLERALVRNVWLYGLGTVIAAGAAWLLFMYLSDRFLKLPAPIRLIHLLVLVGGVAYLSWRTIVRHRRRVPDRVGLAMLAQSTLPEDVPRDDRFVSAMQLVRSTAPDAPSAGLVRRVAERAEEVAPRAELGRVTDPRTPRTRVLVGGLALVTTSAVLAHDPAMASIFGKRMLGAGVPWPRATTLQVEIPSADGALDVDASPEVIRVRAARGSDIPIFVTAVGKVPDVVTFEFESGASIDIGPSGPASFRTVLPSVQEDSVMTVTGGDDDRGIPRVEIEVLQPPDLADLRFVVDPPAYSGLPRRVESGTSVDVLAGSEVTVHIATDPPDATGLARTFPEGDEIALVEAPFPAGESESSVPPAGGDTEANVDRSIAGLAFTRTPRSPLRFRFELTDASGLANPDPALFGIEVVPDRAPELVMLDPGRADIETIAGGSVPLRVLARDDFGVAEVSMSLSTLAGDESLADPIDLELQDVVEEGDAAGRTKLASRLIEIADLRSDVPFAEGTVIELFTEAVDVREPEPNTTTSVPTRIRVVGADEFLRRQRDALARAAEDVTSIGNEVDRTAIEVNSFVLSVSGDDAEAPTRSNVQGVINDALRTQGELEAMTRDLSSIASSMVYSRLDERSRALEARLFELTGASPQRTFQADAWRTIASELQAGRLGTPDRAGDLVRVVALGLEASGARVGAWVDALESLRDADSLDDSKTRLAEVTVAQAELQAAIEALALQLGEWDSLQSIQALARDILNGQRNLVERTRKDAESGR